MVLVSDALTIIGVLASVGRFISCLCDAGRAIQQPMEFAGQLLEWGIDLSDTRELYVTNKKDCAQLVRHRHPLSLSASALSTAPTPLCAHPSSSVCVCVAVCADRPGGAARR